MAKVKLVNKTNQGINILLTNAKGKLVSAVLPSRGTKEIDEAQLSQDVADKVAKKYVAIEVTI